ncbi:hypothetical protein [Nibrella saemangeumensis]
MKIKSVYLETNDIAGTVAFYGGRLGLPIVDLMAKSVTFQVGWSQLHFRVNTQTQPFYHLAFLIPSNQMQEAFAWLSKRTGVLPFTDGRKIAHFENWNAHAFYFLDNHGTILEFIARHELNNVSYKSFNSSSILSINEVGVPVDSVSEAGEFLLANYAIPYFAEGPRMPDFVVMGESEGLLIVPRAGRGWWPTMRPAEKHPIRIQLEHHGKPIELRFHEEIQVKRPLAVAW